MTNIKDLEQLIVRFIENRDWKQFHNMKDLAIALNTEATEVLDELKWKNEKEIKMYMEKNKSKFAEELSDVLYWVLLMSYYADIDIAKEFKKKMKQNNTKYPISKSKGKHTKYTDL